MGYMKRLVPALEIVVVGIYQQLPLLLFVHLQHSAISISIFSSQKNARIGVGMEAKISQKTNNRGAKDAHTF